MRDMKKVLVLGATGMLGSACYKVIAESSSLSVEGTSRTLDDSLTQMNAEELKQVRTVITNTRPDYVVNWNHKAAYI